MLSALFIFLNLVAFLPAYSSTHFSSTSKERTPPSLTFGQKLKILFTGISNPKPVAAALPQRPFETAIIHSNKKLEGWLVTSRGATGTVALFHGYGGEKSSLLGKADAFLNMGQNVLLVDFMGSGGSEGAVTTIGYKEAEEVRDCFLFLQNKGYQNISLFGTSMGAVAIMKALHDSLVSPASVILECPFGTMYETVCARCRTFGVPAFPMASLLVFWGGVQNGFGGFSHNPAEYAKKISCPVLLLYGEQDVKVSRQEINSIYANPKGEKTLRTYPLAGHENYLTQYKPEWTKDVRGFLFHN